MWQRKLDWCWTLDDLVGEKKKVIIYRNFFTNNLIYLFQLNKKQKGLIAELRTTFLYIDSGRAVTQRIDLFWRTGSLFYAKKKGLTGLRTTLKMHSWPDGKTLTTLFHHFDWVKKPDRFKWEICTYFELLSNPRSSPEAPFTSSSLSTASSSSPILVLKIS